jgi:5'-3' exonuclease
MRKIYLGIYCLVALIFIAGCSDEQTTEESANERDILMTIYNALGGPEWTNNQNWGSDKDISEWYGVRVENNYVTRLDLVENNLSGTLPSTIGDLTQLNYLELYNNKIEGTLPASIGNLKHLEFLGFSYNNLTGDIPAEITALPCWPVCGWVNALQKNKPQFTFSTLNLSLPEFSCKDLMTSESISNTSVMQKGELTIVYFWSADYNWQCPILTSLYQHYKSHGLNILGINIDDNTATAREAIIEKEMEGWNHVLKSDITSNGYYTIPAVALLDKEGKLLFYDLYQDIEQLTAIITEKLGEGEFYESKDFSKDGTYETLQEASDGNGINIVLMGDAYSDRLIADGTYKSMMEKACRAFFSEQPYTDFRDLFNVYYVNVVSANEEYIGNKTNTALSCTFGEGTYVEGNWDKGIEYAMKIPTITEDNIDNTLIIVMMNSKRYAGTCHMRYNPDWPTDYGVGNAIAYFPVGESDEALASILHHEAGGHGFAKLADEYFNNEEPDDMAKEKNGVLTLHQIGWYQNIDITNDPTQVYWSKFISDATYKPENIGVFEGAYTYPRGFYRPTETSIMLSNTGGFNAPSRERIYYRIHKLAYGENWAYDYNEFKEWDKKNIRDHGTITRAIPQNFVPLAPPVVKIKR